MEEDTKLLDEVVVVGYGTQKKASITASATITSKLTVAPIASTSNLLVGQLSGLIAKQESGLPKDAASLSIRGFGSALVIVDGIESGLIILMPMK